MVARLALLAVLVAPPALAQPPGPDFAAAVASMKVRHWETARLQLEQVLRTSPDDPAVRNNLAVCLIKLGRYPEAEEHLKAVLDADPTRAGTVLNMGVDQQGLEKTPEALKRTSSAGELWREQGDAGYWRAVAHFNRGWLLDEDSGFDEAIAQARASAAGSVAAKRARDRLEAAVAAYREAVKLRPSYARAWLGLAVSLGKLGRADDARAALKEAERWQATDADVRPLIAANRDALKDADEFGRLLGGSVAPPAPAGKTESAATPPQAAATTPPPPPAEKPKRTLLRDGVTGATGLWDWSKLWTCIILFVLNVAVVGGTAEAFKRREWRYPYPDANVWAAGAAVSGGLLLLVGFGYAGWWKWVVIVIMIGVNVASFHDIRKK